MDSKNSGSIIHLQSCYDILIQFLNFYTSCFKTCPQKPSIFASLLAATSTINAQFLEPGAFDLNAREAYNDNLFVRDQIGLYLRKYFGPHDAAQKVKDGFQGGVTSVKNSKSPGGHNPMPPALGGAIGAVEGIGAILSPSTGPSRSALAKTPIQLKEGKNKAEQEKANAKNAKDTAYQFGETSKKGFQFAAKLGKVEGDAFAASGKIQDKLFGNKPGSPAAKKSKRELYADGLLARALYYQALVDDFYPRDLEDLETRDFEDLDARDFDFEDWF